MIHLKCPSIRYMFIFILLKSGLCSVRTETIPLDNHPLNLHDILILLFSLSSIKTCKYVIPEIDFKCRVQNVIFK